MYKLRGRVLLMWALFLILGVIWVMWNGRKNMIAMREVSRPFECGFDPKDRSRIPFSIRFFLLIIIFLIFDVEISILLGVPYQLDFEFFKGRLGIFLIIWILLIGTLEEYRRGALRWKRSGVSSMKNIKLST